jgi:hypothetical protein
MAHHDVAVAGGHSCGSFDAYTEIAYISFFDHIFLLNNLGYYFDTLYHSVDSLTDPLIHMLICCHQTKGVLRLKLRTRC